METHPKAIEAFKQRILMVGFDTTTIDKEKLQSCATIEAVWKFLLESDVELDDLEELKDFWSDLNGVLLRKGLYSEEASFCGSTDEERIAYWNQESNNTTLIRIRQEQFPSRLLELAQKFIDTCDAEFEVWADLESLDIIIAHEFAPWLMEELEQ